MRIIIDQMAKAKILIRISDQTSTDQALSRIGSCASQTFVETCLSQCGKRMGSKHLNMHDCVTENMEWVRFVRHEWRKHHGFIDRIDNSPAKGTAHSGNEHRHGITSDQIGPYVASLTSG